MSRTSTRPSNRRTKLIPGFLAALLVLNPATGLVFAKEERRNAKQPVARRAVERRDASKAAERAVDPKTQPAEAARDTARGAITGTPAGDRSVSPMVQMPGARQPTSLRDRTKRSGLADRVAAGPKQDAGQPGSRTSLKDRAGRKGLADRLAGRGQELAPKQDTIERAKRPAARLADRVARKSGERGDRGSDGTHGKLPPRPEKGGGVKVTQEEPKNYVADEMNNTWISEVVGEAAGRLSDLNVHGDEQGAVLDAIKEHPELANQLVQEGFLEQFGAPKSWAQLGLSDDKLLQLVEEHFTAGREIAVPELGPDATQEQIDEAAKALEELEQSGKAWAEGDAIGSKNKWLQDHVVGKGNLPAGDAFKDMDLGGLDLIDVVGEVNGAGLPHSPEAIGDVVKWMNGQMEFDDIVAKKEAGGYPEPKAGQDNDGGNSPGSSDTAPQDDPSNPATPTPGADGGEDTGFQDAATDLAGAVVDAVAAGIKWVEGHNGLASPKPGFSWSVSSKGEHVASGWAPTKEEAEKQQEQAKKEHEQKQEKEKQQKEKQEQEKKEKEKQEKKKEEEGDSDDDSEDNEDESDDGAENDQPKENEYTPGPDGPGISPEQHARWMKSVGADKILRIRLDTETFNTKNGSKDTTPDPVGSTARGTYTGSVPKGPGDINKDYVDTPSANQLSLELAIMILQNLGWKDGNGNGVIDYGPDHVGSQPGQGGGQPITDVAGETAAGDGSGEATPTPPKSSSHTDDDDDDDDDDEEAEDGAFADEDDSEYVEIG